MLVCGKMSVDEMLSTLNVIGSEERCRQLRAGELVLVEKSSLKSVAVEPRDFATWKTVALGLHKSSKDYRKALDKDGYHIGDYTGQILDKMEVSPYEVGVDLVVVIVRDLGFKDVAHGVRRDVLYARALELGLQLCPAEVGPALRLLYKDQPRGEWLCIGMEPITVSDGNPNVFEVDNDHVVRCLHSYYGSADSVCTADDCWVFVRPRK